MKLKILKVLVFIMVVCAGQLYTTPISATDNLQRLITGQVLDSQGSPLPGVSVIIKGTTIGTVTDTNGQFSIGITREDQILVISFVGMATREIPVADRDDFRIILEEDFIGIEEVVSVGYGTMRRADLTGAISVVQEEEIGRTKLPNVMYGLQGRIPGVHITGDGNPAGDVNIQIRGITSVRSAPPLIVIDDVPTNINLRDINPNDIQSIQVLKDAASASIYGSRAASGVIIIETKKGREGETNVSYNGSYGVSSFINRIEMMNTQQYGETLWQAAINDGRDPNTVTQIYNYDWGYEGERPVLYQATPREWLNASETMRSADTDWFEAGSQLGVQHDHQLTLSHGTDRAKALFSVNYYDNQGWQIHTWFNRVSLRMNTEYKMLNNRLTIGENFNYSRIDLNSQNHAHSFLTMPSIVPVYTEDGGWGGTAYALGMDDYNNPVRMLTLGKGNNTLNDVIVGNVYAELKILDDFTFRSSYGIDHGLGRFRHINFTWQEGGGKQNINNGVNTWRNNATNTTWTNTLRYNLSTQQHRLDILSGIETTSHYNEFIRGYRWDLEIEDYDYAYLNSATGTQETYGGGDEYTFLSYFGKINYAFNNKYLLGATMRYDGSSRFGRENRFGLFPAFSLGWIMTEESFMANNSILSNLKLRASWGMNGNSNIPTNALINFYDAHYNSTAYGLAGQQTGQLSSGYRRIRTGNPAISWEATRQTDIGIDFGLFNNSLTGSFDWYHKFTDGMLYEPPYIAAIGEGGHRWINAADMTNRGVEMYLTYANRTGDFLYNISGNLHFYRNHIDNLPESVRYTYGGNGLDDDILGLPLSSFYGFIVEGIFQDQDEVDSAPDQPGKGVGRLRFKDLDGDGRITWAHDRTWIGADEPDFMYGLNFSGAFKNIDFSMFWQGVVGNQVRNDWKTYSDFWNVWTQAGFNHSTRLLDAWTPENSGSSIPAVSLINPNDERRLSSYLIESGSYLKLRQLQVGYTLSDAFINRIGIQRARVYVQGQNLLSFHKWWGDNAYTSIDPESPSKAGEYSAPYQRPLMFMMGVDVSF